MTNRRVVYLTRDKMQMGLFGTFGKIETGTFECISLERPPACEHPCIPEGEYNVDPRTDHPHHNPCYEIMNVPGRTAILIHAANWFEQLQGCVAPGKVITDRLEGEWNGEKISHKGIMGSRDALAALIKDLEFKPFQLIIREV